MANCRLCSAFSVRTKTEDYNNALFESQNFVVLPSLGALVEGWLLLVPKRHFICMGGLPSSLTVEMQAMKEQVATVLMSRYGDVCAFEHGPSGPNCDIGCGVDHAHVHLVPLDFDLASAAIPFMPQGVSWSSAHLYDCHTAFGRGKEYLYLEQPIGKGRIVTYGSMGSQLFRRAIATHLGIPQKFNWREHPKHDVVSATIDSIRPLTGREALWNGLPGVAAV